MKNFIYRIALKYELFAERIYNRAKIEICPVKWRVAIEDRFHPIPADDLMALYEAGGHVDKFLEWKAAQA